MARVRAPIVRIVDHGDSTTVIGPRGALRFDGDSAQLVRAVLEIHARPISREQLFASLAERSGGEVPTKPVDDLLALLSEATVLVEATEPRTVATPRAPGRRVVLAISGAVAAVDAPVLVRGLHALGCDVRIALTKTAQRFVAVPALQALVHHQVWRGLWQRDERTPVPHINLAEWAELVIVWPASATTIARIASGDCSDLVSAIATATRAPVVIAPSMNDAMMGAPAVQSNLQALRDHGRFVVHGALGIEVAHRPEERIPMFGPSAPPAAIVDIVRHLLVDVFPRPRLPVDGAAWEQLWATTPVDQLPWTSEPIDAPLAVALDRLAATPREQPSSRDARLLDLGTGTGIVAIEAAKRGYRVTATDVSATALGRAKHAAGALPILFALDDAIGSPSDSADLAPNRSTSANDNAIGDRSSSKLPPSDALASLDPFDLVTDRGLLHCLPPAARARYAAVVTARTAPGGTLLVIAHTGTELATHPITANELASLLPAFRLHSTTPTSLSGGPANLYELRRT